MITQFIGELEACGYEIYKHYHFSENGLIQIIAKFNIEDLGYKSCQVDVRNISDETYQNILEEVKEFLQ